MSLVHVQITYTNVMKCTSWSFRELSTDTNIPVAPYKDAKCTTENDLIFLALWFRYPNCSQGVDIHISTWNMESHESSIHVKLKTTNLPCMLCHFITLPPLPFIISCMTPSTSYRNKSVIPTLPSKKQCWLWTSFSIKK